MTFCQTLIDGTPDWDSDGGKLNVTFCQTFIDGTPDCRGPFAQGIEFDNMSDGGGCMLHYDCYHMHGMGMMGGLPYKGFRFIVGMGWI